MASPSTAKLLLLRRLSRALKSLESPSSPSLSCIKRSSAYSPACFLEASKRALDHPASPCSRSFCSPPTSLKDEGPATIDYRSLLQEDEFHKLADSTIQDLLEKLEEYGDSTDIDGFDIDYGNHVLTLKLGTLGTYVLNKQTPNRQIWLSSPVRLHYMVRGRVVSGSQLRLNSKLELNWPSLGSATRTPNKLWLSSLPVIRCRCFTSVDHPGSTGIEMLRVGFTEGPKCNYCSS